MNKWESIKKSIKLETKDYFMNKRINTDDLVDVLNKVFDFPIDSQFLLDGLSSNYKNSLYKVLDDDSSKAERFANFEILKNVEPFLKKILFLHDPEEFLYIRNELKGLAPILKTLNLNTKNIWYSEEELNKYTDQDYEYHLIRTYILRNTESHNAQEWSRAELDENIKSLLIFYLEVVNRCKNLIDLKGVKFNHDFTGYIDSEIAEFKTLAHRFIATETIEDYSAFESYAIEDIKTYDEDDDEDDDNTAIERSGTVDEIRRNKLSEKRMILWGEAGLGKTTTLQYLTYLDALDYKNKKSKIIPVYIPLGLLIDNNVSLESYIFDKICVDAEVGYSLLENGLLNVFLDGINEIPEDKTSKFLSRRIKEIQSLCDKYTKSLIIITNRPEKYSQFEKIPVFRLQPMDYKRIVEFLNRNAKNKEIITLIKNKLENNPRLINLISTPLMATRLLFIVTVNKKIPEKEGLIIKEFLDALFKREVIEKKDLYFEEDKINYLLISLAVYGFKKYGTNAGLSKEEVLNCFSNCLSKYHFDYDILYSLKILVTMGVLSCNYTNEIFVFSHQAYQDYYVACAEGFILLEKDENNVQLKIDDSSKFYATVANNPKYEKSIIYKIHTDNNEEGQSKIKDLAKYNIKLAAKTFVSGIYEEDIQDFLINEAKEKFRYEDDLIKRDGLIALFLLNSSSEDIIDCLKLLLLKGKHDDKIKYKRILIAVASELDLLYIKEMLYYICCEIHLPLRVKIEYLRSILHKNMERDLQILWDEEKDIIMIENISRFFLSWLLQTERYSKYYKYSKYFIKIYMDFNLPQKYLDNRYLIFARYCLGGPNDGKAIKFIQQYFPKERVSFKDRIFNYLNNKGKKPFLYVSKSLEKLLCLQDEIDDFILLFIKDGRIRSLVFLFLGEEMQNFIYCKYGYRYEEVDVYIYKNKRFCDEAFSNLIRIVKDNLLYEKYSEPCDCFPGILCIKREEGSN